MTLIALCFLAAMPEVASVRLVTAGQGDARPALRIVVAAPLTTASVDRDGREVVIRVGAEVPKDLVLPSASPPLESIRLEREAEGAAFFVAIPPEVPFEVHRDGLLLAIVFGEASALPELPSIAEQYGLLFPSAPSAKSITPGGSLLAPTSPFDFELGILHIRPSIVATYIDADVLDPSTGKPIHDSYLQLQPGFGTTAPLGVGVSLWDGRLKASYEPRFRFLSNFEPVLTPTHIATAGVDLPVGAVSQFRANYRYVNGLLETTEVDRGREYFYRLGKFVHQEIDGEYRYGLGARLDATARLRYSMVEMRQPAGFFSYDRGEGRLEVGYEMTASTRAALGYVYEWVPENAERPVVEEKGHGPAASFRSQLTPRLSVTLDGRWLQRSYPNAASGATEASTLAFGAAALERLGDTAQVGVRLGRSHELSAYESNPFYDSSRADLWVAVPVPLGFTVNGSLGGLRNDYPLPSTSLGAPRRDTITGWSAGIARTLGRWGFLRADYRWEQRDSNVDAFDLTTHSLTAAIGLGFLGEPAKP